jgi:hypothetical protein
MNRFIGCERLRLLLQLQISVPHLLRRISLCFYGDCGVVGWVGGKTALRVCAFDSEEALMLNCRFCMGRGRRRRGGSGHLAEAPDAVTEALAEETGKSNGKKESAVINVFDESCEKCSD